MEQCRKWRWETAAAIHQKQLNTKSGKLVFKCYSIFRVDLWRERTSEEEKYAVNDIETDEFFIRSNSTVFFHFHLTSFNNVLALDVLDLRGKLSDIFGCCCCRWEALNWIMFVSGALILYIKGKIEFPFLGEEANSMKWYNIHESFEFSVLLDIEWLKQP